jgi:hypothetical protein
LFGVAGVSLKRIVSPRRVAVADHPASGCGRLDWALLNSRAMAMLGAGRSGLTSSVSSRLASPGMQTSSHMSQSALARSVTGVPAGKWAGGVMSTKRKTVPS